MDKHLLISRKLILLLITSLIAVLFVIFAVGCSGNKVKIGTTYDATSVSCAKLIEDKNYNITTVTNSNSLVEDLEKAKLDIALIPSNQAASLYNKEHSCKVISIVNLCSADMLSQNTNLNDTKDLMNVNIYSNEENTSLGVMLSIIAEKNGLQSKNVRNIYKSNSDEVLSAITNDPKAIGVAVQPQASFINTKDNNIYKVFSVKEAWDNVFGSDCKPATLVTVVSNNFLEKNKNAVNKFLEDQKASVEFIQKNPAEATYSVNKIFNQSSNSFDMKDIANTEVVYYDGQEMKSILDKFYKIIYDFDPNTISNVIPDDNFYYIEK